MRWPLLSLSITLVLGSTPAISASTANPDLLRGWIENQSRVTSLSGEFSQERKLKVLRKPLVSPGRFWYEAPDRFRWELGTPARSVAIHAGKRFTLVDVEKGKAEVHDTATPSEDPRLVAYFDLSFPRDWATFQKDFRVLTLREEGATLLAELEPVNPRAARGVRTITFEIDRKELVTRGFALSLKDGSEMRTTFSDVRRNVPLPPSTFSVSLDGLRLKERDG